MDPPPFKEYQNELQSLGYSPILGNRESKQASFIPKLNSDRPKSSRISANSVAKNLSSGHVTPRKRLFSEAQTSPSELDQNSKMTKKERKSSDSSETKKDQKSSEFSEILSCIKTEIRSVRTDMADTEKRLGDNMADTEKRLGDKLENKFEQLTDQISDLRTKQESEVIARKDLETKVNTMQDKVDALSNMIEQSTPANAEALAEVIDTKIEEAVARQMRSKDNQINATYYQSLVNELKNHEKDLMIFGFRTDGSPNLENQVRNNVFKDKLGLDIGQFKALQVGTENDGKPKPIRVSFPSSEVRNSVCKQANKLPRGIQIEKCLPQRYRQKNKDFRHYGWQLKEAANVQTRVVFKGHKLVLEFKEHDKDDNKYDWTIAKEYFPQPVSPTDRGEADRDRRGLKPSKTIEQIETNKVIVSNLNVNADLESTMAYFENNFLEPADRDKVGVVVSDRLMTKNLLIVSLPNKQDCADFKNTYEKKDFNGKKPRISVMLGNS